MDRSGLQGLDTVVPVLAYATVHSHRKPSSTVPSAAVAITPTSSVVIVAEIVVENVVFWVITFLVVAREEAVQLELEMLSARGGV